MARNASKLLLLIGLLLLSGFITFAQRQRKPAPYFKGSFKVKITGTGSYQETETCSHFRLKVSDVEKFFRRAKPITQREFHDEYMWLPCYVTGTIRSKNKVYEWKIAEGATAVVLTPNGEEVMLGCKPCGPRFEYEDYR